MIYLSILLWYSDSGGREHRQIAWLAIKNNNLRRHLIHLSELFGSGRLCSASRADRRDQEGIQRRDVSSVGQCRRPPAGARRRQSNDHRRWLSGFQWHDWSVSVRRCSTAWLGLRYNSRWRWSSSPACSLATRDESQGVSPWWTSLRLLLLSRPDKRDWLGIWRWRSRLRRRLWVGGLLMCGGEVVLPWLEARLCLLKMDRGWRQLVGFMRCGTDWLISKKE